MKLVNGGGVKKRKYEEWQKLNEGERSETCVRGLTD